MIFLKIFIGLFEFQFAKILSGEQGFSINFSGLFTPKSETDEQEEAAQEESKKQQKRQTKPQQPQPQYQQPQQQMFQPQYLQVQYQMPTQTRPVVSQSPQLNPVRVPSSTKRATYVPKEEDIEQGVEDL